MEKDYLNRKVKQCRKLVREATSDAQKKVYKGYLNLWLEEVEPKPVKKSKKEKPVKVQVSEEILTELEEETEQFLDDEPEPEPKQTLKEVIEEFEEELPETPIDYAADFELAYPNKMAYRRKDGKLVETLAFKEFLNERTQ